MWPPELAWDKGTLRVRPDRAEAAFRRTLADHRIETDLSRLYREVYLPLALWIEQQSPQERPLLVGLSGAQGSGKSTLRSILHAILSVGMERNVAGLSIDDLYLPKSARRALATSIHPLLRTRGVPGTHDVAMGISLLDRFEAADAQSRIPIPAFDKSTDERRRRDQWPVHEGRPDVVLFDGWCVGARPQSPRELAQPINALEESSDADGTWRAYVNQRLETEYAELFGRIDLLVMLKVPSFEKVYEWRQLQEEKLVEREGRTDETMTPRQLRRFIMHYERLTRHALAEMPARCDVCLEIDDSHQICAVRSRSKRD